MFIVLLNGPFWILSSHSFVSRATISLDSLLALLLFQYSSVWGSIAIAVSWLCDAVINASFTYQFASPLDFFHSAAFANHIDWTKYLQPRAAVVAAPFVVALIAVKRLQRQAIGAWPICAAIAILVAVDAANGSSALSLRDVRWVPTNIAGSSWYSVARATLADNKGETPTSVVPGTGGQIEFDRYLPSAVISGRSVLYVIVESLGVHQNAAVRDWLRQQLYPTSMVESYDLSVDTIVALGGTTSGEMRRLCGLQGAYRLLTVESGAACLPRALGDAGWSTVGLHGFSAKMFGRREWWPLIGLKDIRFAEQLTEETHRQCGAAFRGVCDEDLIAAAVRATDTPRTFVYALTLNSHLPVAPIDIPDDLASVCAQADVGKSVCTLLAYPGITLRAVARQLSARATKPFVILVGDHSPPFFDRHSRGQFLHDRVPLFALTPKRVASR